MGKSPGASSRVRWARALWESHSLPHRLQQPGVWDHGWNRNAIGTRKTEAGHSLSKDLQEPNDSGIRGSLSDSREKSGSAEPGRKRLHTGKLTSRTSNIWAKQKPWSTKGRKQAVLRVRVSPPCAPHTHPCLNLSPDYRSETPGFKYGYFGLPSPTCENKIKENIYPKEKPKEK